MLSSRVWISSLEGTCPAISVSILNLVPIISRVIPLSSRIIYMPRNGKRSIEESSRPSRTNSYHSMISMPVSPSPRGRPNRSMPMSATGCCTRLLREVPRKEEKQWTQLRPRMMALSSMKVSKCEDSSGR